MDTFNVRLLSKILLFIVAVISLNTILLAQDMELQRSEFLPGRLYEITVKKTITGNNDGKEMIPILSSQTITVETGDESALGIPVTLVVYPTRTLDAKPAQNTNMQIEWSFSFLLTKTGDIENIKGETGEGNVPPELTRPFLMNYLDEVLFASKYRIDRKNRGPIQIVSKKPSGESNGRIELEYVFEHDMSAEQSAATAMSTSSKGSASYDGNERFFTERINTETTNIYIAEDALVEAKVVTMVSTTKYLTKITKK